MPRGQFQDRYRNLNFKLEIDPRTGLWLRLSTKEQTPLGLVSLKGTGINVWGADVMIPIFGNFNHFSKMANQWFDYYFVFLLMYFEYNSPIPLTPGIGNLNNGENVSGSL
jgi:hypothetical protein